MIGKKRLAIRVCGRVQGVGFRYFAQDSALTHQITGWVCNTDTGEVELEAQGEPEDIEKFTAEIRQGPPLAFISGLTAHAIPVQSQEFSFDIRH